MFRTKDDVLDETPEGVYSIAEQKIILEPQYGCVDILSDQLFAGEMHSKKYNKQVVIICDRSGTPRFDSKYSLLFRNRKTGLLDGNIERDCQSGDWVREIIDVEGRRVTTCCRPSPFDGVDFVGRTIICWDNGKLGMRDFDDNILIAHTYDKMHRMSNGLIEVSIKTGDEYMQGLIDKSGNLLLPTEYNELSVNEDGIILAKKNGVFECLKIMRSLNQ